MKKKKAVIFLFAMFFFLSPLFSQEEVFYNRSVSLVPQYLFINGVRLDFERQLSGRSALVICPQFYLRENSGGIISSSYNQLLGGGLSVYHKLYLNPENPDRKGLYFGYGAGYNYFSLTYDVFPEETKTEIHAISGNILIGVQEIFNERILLDIYAGLGHKYSFRTFGTELGERKKYNNTMFDYGYTGNVLHLGFKLGFLF